MSVKKYELAREVRKGASARILNMAQESPKSPAFMVGFDWANRNMNSLYDQMNVFLKGIGEEEISMVEVMRNKEKNEN